MPIKVLVVDDQRLFRQSLACMLQQDTEIRIVGEAADGQEAFSMAVEKKPDIVLMDLDLPKVDGVEATKSILNRYPRTKILILSVFGDQDHISRGLEAGAVGYILKDADFEEFVRIIKHYARNLPITSPFLTSLSYYKSSSKTVVLTSLTQRENEIVELVAEGLSSKDISERLNISVETVKVHLQHIYRKLGVKSRVELIVSMKSKAVS
jgi:DNA-binding NarL/FixJ family response regulator